MEEKDREGCLRSMRQASAMFYRAAVTAGNHAFIEFTGLMNEYINLCEAAHAAGIDFTCANKHNEHLPWEDHHKQYLNEKLECIYGVTFKIDEPAGESATSPGSPALATSEDLIIARQHIEADHTRGRDWECTCVACSRARAADATLEVGVRFDRVKQLEGLLAAVREGDL